MSGDCLDDDKMDTFSELPPEVTPEVIGQMARCECGGKTDGHGHGYHIEGCRYEKTERSAISRKILTAKE